jgi:hypothetical protein
MKRVFILSIALIGYTYSSAQTAEDSVKQIVNQMFVAMKTSDVSLLKASFTDSAFLQTIATDKITGRMKIKTDDINSFATMVAQLPKNSADERITFDGIRIDGDLASVWTPTNFIITGALAIAV